MELLVLNLQTPVFGPPPKSRKCGPKPHQPLYFWKACGNSRFKFIFSKGSGPFWGFRGQINIFFNFFYVFQKGSNPIFSYLHGPIQQ